MGNKPVTIKKGIGLSEDIQNPFWPFTLFFSGTLGDLEDIEDLNVIDLLTIENDHNQYYMIDLGTLE